MVAILVLTILLVAATIGFGVYAVKKQLSNEKTMKVLGLNMGTFVLLLVGATIFIISGNVSYASATAAVLPGVSNGEGLKFIGAALSTGMACIGTGIAVAAASSAAIGAISEDAKLLGKTIIFVGLSEGIAIYGLIISIMILG